MRIQASLDQVRELEASTFNEDSCKLIFERVLPKIKNIKWSTFSRRGIVSMTLFNHLHFFNTL